MYFSVPLPGDLLCSVTKINRQPKAGHFKRKPKTHMFTSNPWAVYAGILAGALLIYYTFVGWKYFRTEINSLLGGRPRKRQFDAGTLSKAIGKTSDPSRPDQEIINEQDPQPEWRNEEMSTRVENLYEHLATEIEEAHQKGYDRQDLIQMLQIILKDYQMLKRSPFQFAVNNRIDAECAKYGSIHLSEGDKGEVWGMF